VRPRDLEFGFWFKTTESKTESSVRAPTGAFLFAKAEKGSKTSFFYRPARSGG